MENIVKLKTNLIHLNYQTSKLGLAYLKHVENTYISLQLGKIIQHNECTVSISCSPSWLHGWLGAVATAAVRHKNIIQHIISSGKGQNSKLKVWFLLNAYGFRTIIKLKTRKSNHLKSQTGCVVLSFFSSGFPPNLEGLI